MRRKYQRDDKQSEFVDTYPRPHFCQPSTTPNTPLGNQSPSLEATENDIRRSLKRFFYSKAAVASPTSFTKKERNPAAVGSLWDNTKRNGWLTCEYPFCSLGPTFQWAAESSACTALADHSSAMMLNCWRWPCLKSYRVD